MPCTAGCSAELYMDTSPVPYRPRSCIYILQCQLYALGAQTTPEDRQSEIPCFAHAAYKVNCGFLAGSCLAERVEVPELLLFTCCL